MSYIVIELQTTDGVTATITNSYTSKNEAEQKFHNVLAAAAVSNVDIHSASMIDIYGNVIKCESYEHNIETDQVV